MLSCLWLLSLRLLVSLFQELQDQIDELHSELEEYRAQGKVLRPSLKNLLSEEFDIDMKSHGNSGIEPDQGKAHLLYNQLLCCRYANILEAISKNFPKPSQ